MKYIVFIIITVLAVPVANYEFNLRDKDFEIEQIKKQHRYKINLLESQLSATKIEVASLYEQLGNTGSEKVILTWYHPESGGINTDGDPYRTATMTKPKVGRTIAISKELVRKGWLGKRVYIEGYGVFVAEDRMSSALPGCRIDICCASKKIAMCNGKKRNIFCSVLYN
jgi:3D (Asp-Asp-Asp) domain-containing protein